MKIKLTLHFAELISSFRLNTKRSGKDVSLIKYKYKIGKKPLILFRTVPTNFVLLSTKHMSLFAFMHKIRKQYKK